MVLINGRKFACEACIRGHRASNCSHTGRRLQLVRKKGRPSSQCDICRSKRANGNFHGRCDCGEDQESKSPQLNNKKQRGKSDQDIETFTPFLVQHETSLGELHEEGSISQSKHSLQSLMNPCQCKTTGICSCCSRASSSKDGMLTVVKTASVDQPASCGCNGDNQCCDDGIDSVQCEPLTTEDPTLKAIKPSCCSSKPSEQIQPAHDTAVLNPATVSLPMTTEEADAILAPDCHCGPDCACPGCLMENEDIRKKRKQGDEECPDKCLTCSACVLGLTRPSGIEAVDAWMEQDKQNAIEKNTLEEPANDISTLGNMDEVIPSSAEQSSLSNAIGSESEASDESDEVSSSLATAPEGSSRKSLSPSSSGKISFIEPPLPPFPSAKKYYEDHFLNPERRRFFADQIQKQSINNYSPLSESFQPKNNVETEFGERLDGETDEEWQARHGFRFLTPDAIKIFDHAKRFREEKRRAEEEEDLIARREEEAQIASTEMREDELSLLRQRALSARKKQKMTAN